MCPSMRKPSKGIPKLSYLQPLEKFHDEITSLGFRKFQKSQTSFAVKRVSNKSINYASLSIHSTYGTHQRTEMSQCLQKLSHFPQEYPLLTLCLMEHTGLIPVVRSSNHNDITVREFLFRGIRIQTHTHIPIRRNSLFAQSK